MSDPNNCYMDFVDQGGGGPTRGGGRTASNSGRGASHGGRATSHGGRASSHGGRTASHGGRASSHGGRTASHGARAASRAVRPSGGFTSNSHASTGQRAQHPPRSPSPPAHQSPPHFPADGDHARIPGHLDAFYADIRDILYEPGHHLLPHLHPLRPPNTFWFTDDPSVASSVTEIFERDYKEPHGRWSDVQEADIIRWFGTFARKYHWDAGITEVVYQEFKNKVKQRLPDMVSRWKQAWRKKGDAAMPAGFSTDVWAGLVAFWLDPDHQTRSTNSKATRSMSKNSTHRSGRLSYRARGRMLAESNGESETDLLAVLALTKRNPDGSFMDEDSEELYNDVSSKVHEMTQESIASGSAEPSTAMRNKVFVDIAPRKKGRIRGVGSLQSQIDTRSGSIRGSASSRFQDHDEVARLQDELTATKTKVEVFQEMFDYLGSTDPKLKEIMSRLYPEQQQVQGETGGTSGEDPSDPSGPYENF